MPELPEVENVVRSLRPHVELRRILDARFLSPLAAGGRPDQLAACLAGRRIERLRRLGKFLVFDLDQGVMTIHLRMTGQLLAAAHPGPHTRLILEFDRGALLFDDIRQFGRVTWSPDLPPNVAALGPEPFDLTPRDFAARLRARRGALKPLLLNQHFLSGLGNIYVDEALFRARLHPLTRAHRVSAPRAAALLAASVEILHDAIAAGGSSISDYVDAEGRAGSFQRFHQVYGRQGEPCPRCTTPILRIVVGQRGTHLCPTCQRR